MEQAVPEEYKKDLRYRMISFIKKKEEEFQRELGAFLKEQQLAVYEQKMPKDKKRMQLTLEESIRKSVTGDFKNKSGTTDCS